MGFTKDWIYGPLWTRVESKTDVPIGVHDCIDVEPTDDKVFSSTKKAEWISPENLVKFCPNSPLISWFQSLFKQVSILSVSPLYNYCNLWHFHWYTKDDYYLMIFHTNEFCDFNEKEFTTLCTETNLDDDTCTELFALTQNANWGVKSNYNFPNTGPPPQGCGKCNPFDQYRHTIVYSSKTNHFYFIEDYKNYLKMLMKIQQTGAYFAYINEKDPTITYTTALTFMARNMIQAFDLDESSNKGLFKLIPNEKWEEMGGQVITTAPNLFYWETPFAKTTNTVPFTLKYCRKRKRSG